VRTFGGATTHLIDFGPGSPSWFTGNHGTIVSCWAYPTTLTAGRYIWATGGTITGCGIHTTTSDLTIDLNAATTPGKWTVANVLTVNTMVWICVMTAQNSAGGTAAVRCWTATETTGPVERTVVNATAPIGAWTSSGTTFRCGNLGTTVSFQGDLGGFIAAVDDWQGHLPVIGNQTVGAITQAEADRVLATWCDPMWRGDIGALAGAGRLGSPQRLGALNGLHIAASLDDPKAEFISNKVIPAAGQITGATLSTRRTPHTFENMMDNRFAGAAALRNYMDVEA
jgi:hypothetical protein